MILINTKEWIYTSIRLEDDKGNIIDHLEFNKVNDPKKLEIMIKNAMFNLKTHSENGSYRQIVNFAESINSGFEHSRGLLGKNFSKYDFPILYGAFVDYCVDNKIKI